MSDSNQVQEIERVTVCLERVAEELSTQVTLRHESNHLSHWKEGVRPLRGNG